MTTSLGRTTSIAYIHLPPTRIIHSSPPPRRRNVGKMTTRNVEEEASYNSSSYHSCVPPSPRNESHYNPNTNETLHFVTDVEVYEIGILFDYEIHHDEGTSWGVSSGGGWGDAVDVFVDDTKDFFGDLFGNGDEKDGDGEGGDEEEEKEEDDDEEEDAGRVQLMELDEYMAARFWNDTLLDDDMTWNDDRECMGLLITEEAGSENVSDAGSNSTEYETKLLGISYEPLDYVNPDGETSYASFLTCIFKVNVPPR